MPSWCDWDAIRRARLASEPFAWAVVRDAFPTREARRRLEEEFPTDGFIRTERVSGTPGRKGYRTDNLPLVEAGQQVKAGVRRLSPAWRALIEGLLSDAYRSAVADLTGRRLDGCALEVRAVRYGPGSWIDPHTDRADKVVTQTWYFNSGWLPQWRGALRILNSPAEDDVADEVYPQLGESVVLLPSERSWHAVTPVADTATQDRLTLLAHFVAADAT